VFSGELSTTNGITTQGSPNKPVFISRNRFLGTAIKIIQLAHAGNYWIEDNFFESISNPSNNISVEAGFSSTHIVRNTFSAATGSGHIRINAAAAVSVRNNNFIGTGGANVSVENTAVDLTLIDNQFSQGAGVTLDLIATPTTPIQMRGNYGNALFTHVASVASAATITLPKINNLVNITGTTTINAINPTAAGHVVTLKFNAAIVVSDTANVRLNGVFVADIDDTLMLVCDGTNWFEVGRTTN
jgi:hypothetical protein